MLIKKICADLYYTLLNGKRHSIKVHSIFSNAVNFLLNDNRIFAVLSERAELRPFTILVEGLNTYNFKQGQWIYIQDNSICINNIRMPLYKNDIEDCCIKKECVIITEQIKDNLNINMKVVLSTLKKKQLSLFSCGVLDSLSGINTNSVASSIVNLKEALQNRDYNAMSYISENLCGYGEGLTPAADDFLCGVMLSEIMFKLDGNKANQSIISRLINKTNIISYNYLLCAHDGLAPESLRKLLYMLTQNPNNKLVFIEHIVNKVCSFGATSGSDICCGIYFSLMCLR